MKELEQPKVEEIALMGYPIYKEGDNTTEEECYWIEKFLEQHTTNSNN